MFLSERSKYAENPLEEDNYIADNLDKKGRHVIRLNRGDPAVYFPTPDYIKDAYVNAIKDGKTHYTEPIGALELREAIANRYKRMFNLKVDAESITITQGVSEALYILNAALVNKNDHAIVFAPYYTQYMPYIKLAGGKPYILDYKENDGWSIDTDELEKHIRALKKKRSIRYMLLTNPNNPTGTVLDKKVLKEVVGIANEHDLLLVSDEIYDEIVYNGAKFTSIAQLAKGMPYVILNGASKAYDATGFRIGYMLTPENDEKSEALKRKFAQFAAVRVSANTPAEYAIAEGINNVKEHNKALKNMVKQIESRVNLSTKLLNENEFLETVRPNGAYYILPRVNLKALDISTDKEFTDKFLEEEYVQLSRGSGFGAKSHVRIVALPPKEILEAAITRLNDFCKKHAK